MTIPKRLHQICLQGEAYIPAEIKISIAELRARNPDWQYQLYDESAIQSYITQHYGMEMLNTYLSIQPCYGAARSDLFRYLLLYQEGGVYLDLKSSCLTPLSEVVQPEDRFILCGWENEPGQSYAGYGKNKHLTDFEFGEYQQWNIMAAAHSEFLKAVIDEVCYRIHHYQAFRYHVGRKGVLNTTGPVPYTLAIGKIIRQGNTSYRYIRYASDIGLIYKNADTTLVNQNHYSKQLLPVVKLGPASHFLYLVWLYVFHPKKVFSKKNRTST